MTEPANAIVSIQFLIETDGIWGPIRLPLRKREPLRYFLRNVLDKNNFRRNAFSNSDIWIQDSTAVRPIGRLNEEYTIQLRRMKVLKKSRYVQSGYFIFPNWETQLQKSGDCDHEFALILKIAEGRNFTEEKFKFFM